MSFRPIIRSRFKKETNVTVTIEGEPEKIKELATQIRSMCRKSRVGYVIVSLENFEPVQQDHNQ